MGRDGVGQESGEGELIIENPSYSMGVVAQCTVDINSNGGGDRSMTENKSGCPNNPGHIMHMR